MVTLAEELPFAAVVCDEYLAKTCSSCFSSKEDISRCTRCRVIHYCSVDCQKTDWKNHKYECSFLEKCSPQIPSYMCRLISRIAMKLEQVEAEEPAFNGRVYDVLCRQFELERDPDHSKFFDIVSYSLQEFMGEKFVPNRDRLMSIYGKILAYCFTIHDESASIGQGLYIGLSCHKPHCTPGAYIHFDGPMAILRSVDKDKKYSTNLTVAYNYRMQPKRGSPMRVLHTYNFICKCSQCTAKSKKDLLRLSAVNSTCCPNSYRIFDDATGLMTCCKCRSNTGVCVNDRAIPVATKPPLLEPKIEEPDEMDEPESHMDQIVREMKEAEDGLQHKATHVRFEPPLSESNCEEEEMDQLPETTEELETKQLMAGLFQEMKETEDARAKITSIHSKQPLVEPKIEEPEEMDELPEETERQKTKSLMARILQELKDAENGLRAEAAYSKPPVLEPKIEEPDDMDAFTESHMDRIVREMKEAEDGLQAKKKKKVTFADLPTTSRQSMSNVKFVRKFTAPPIVTNRMVIRSDGRVVYSTSFTRTGNGAIRKPTCPASRNLDTANAFCASYEKEMTTVKPPSLQPKGIYPVRRLIPNILAARRDTTATEAMRNVVLVPVRNQNLRIDHSHNSYVTSNGKKIERPDWSFSYLIALCILCSENGYVNTPEVYEFIEHYFPWYNTNVTRSYRSSVRNSLSRICNKYIVGDDIRSIRASCWTLCESRLRDYENVIFRFVQRKEASVGVNEFDTLLSIIHWNRPALIADRPVTNLPGRSEPVKSRQVGGVAARIWPLYNHSISAAFKQRGYGQSTSAVCKVTSEDSAAPSTSFHRADQEFEVKEYDKPNWKYAHMLGIGLLVNGGVAPLQNLYSFIGEYFPYYAKTSSWKSSARNALSGSPYFERVENDFQDLYHRQGVHKLRDDKKKKLVEEISNWMANPASQIGVHNFDILESIIDRNS